MADSLVVVVDDRKVVGGAKAEAIGADRSVMSANFMFCFVECVCGEREIELLLWSLLCVYVYLILCRTELTSRNEGDETDLSIGEEINRIDCFDCLQHCQWLMNCVPRLSSVEASASSAHGR